MECTLKSHIERSGPQFSVTEKLWALQEVGPSGRSLSIRNMPLKRMVRPWSHLFFVLHSSEEWLCSVMDSQL